MLPCGQILKTRCGVDKGQSKTTDCTSPLTENIQRWRICRNKKGSRRIVHTEPVLFIVFLQKTK